MTLNEAWAMPKTTKELLQSWHMKVLGKEKPKTWNALPSVVCGSSGREGTQEFLKAKRKSVTNFFSVFPPFSWCDMAILK